MKSPVFFLVILGVGLLLLFLSFALPWISPPEKNWSLEEYQSYQETLAKGHAISHQLEHASKGSRKALEKQVLENQQEISQLNTVLGEARDGPKTTTRVLKWSGISLALVGVLGWYVKQKSLEEG